MTRQPKVRSGGGRPRNAGLARGGNPRSEILSAALALFAERGFANTTMSAIAEAVGLQQSSLYYWFPNKESLLRHVLSVNRVPLDLIQDLEEVDQPASVKVFRILRCDTYQLCRSPIDFNEIERIGLEAPDALADFWLDYAKLQAVLHHLLQEGQRAGEFRELDPELTSLALLCLDEGLQKRFRTQQHRNRDSLPFQHRAYPAEQYATFAAMMALSSILARPDDADKVRVAAESFDDFAMARGSSGR